MDFDYSQSELITAGSIAQTRAKNLEQKNSPKNPIENHKRLDEQVRNSMSVPQFMARQTGLYQSRGHAN